MQKSSTGKSHGVTSNHSRRGIDHSGRHRPDDGVTAIWPSDQVTASGRQECASGDSLEGWTCDSHDAINCILCIGRGGVGAVRCLFREPLHQFREPGKGTCRTASVGKPIELQKWPALYQGSRVNADDEAVRSDQAAHLLFARFVASQRRRYAPWPFAPGGFPGLVEEECARRTDAFSEWTIAASRCKREVANPVDGVHVSPIALVESDVAKPERACVALEQSRPRAAGERVTRRNPLVRQRNACRGVRDVLELSHPGAWARLHIE